ncbi:uncharacterized protein LOC136035528 isoform X2 [Artemia franciscana]|uniref:uncharacterized protein LOC136035528 isoform X2 n=1 Tax=Artemia franciscana TaxID=6661 RepID=UPI0032DA2B63
MNESISNIRAVLANLDMNDSPNVTIQCEGGDLTVEKILLTGTSDVFRSMFTSDMLERRQNFVEADDVDFNTMKTVIDCYKEGFIPDLAIIDKKAFTYVVEKYNFIGIKEAMAEHVFDTYVKDKDIELLKSIFTTYDCPVVKIAAIKEIALLIIQGKTIPGFIDDFDVHDFFELSRICCAPPMERETGRFEVFLNCFYRWVSKNPEERSDTAMRILGMMDIRKFSVTEVLKIFESLSLSKRFQGFKLMFETTLKFIVENEKETYTYTIKDCNNEVLYCTKCQHPFSRPFHSDRHCGATHRCRTCTRNRSFSCEQRLPYMNYATNLFESLDTN